MRIWLWDTFGRERVFWHGKDEDGVINTVVRARGVKYFSRYAAVGGHFVFTNRHIQALPQPKIFSAVFRRPAEQVVSHFEFVSQLPEHAFYFDGTLEDALTTDTAFLRASTNNQCLQSTGCGNAVDALKVIDHYEFILGCFDSLPKFVECVATTLNLPRRELPRANVQDTDYFKKHYTPRVAELIREITREDEAVYQRVLKEGVLSTIHAPRVCPGTSSRITKLSKHEAD